MKELGMTIYRRVAHRFTIIILLIFATLFSRPAQAEESWSTKPTRNGELKWRIGYLQGGDYGSYQKTLMAMVTALMRLGWIAQDELPTPPNDKDTGQLWQWLANNSRSDYLQFVGNAYYDSRWDKDSRVKTRAEVITRLNEKQDIDLMLALGTWAGQDLATNEHHIPTIVGSTTDPVGAKIIVSPEDSGFDHIHAKVDPGRHRRQVRLFHQIFNFKTLGIVYEESLEGRGFSAVDSVYEESEKLQFKVVKCEAPFNGVSQQEAEERVNDCYRKLAKSVDAVYIVRHPGVNLKNLPNIIKPLIDSKIPSFAQGLSEEVEHGILLSISLANFSYIGDFYALTIAKIFNGAKPRQLTQVFQNPPQIAINLKTAQLIDYDPSVDIVGAADEIFTEIAPPPSSAD